MNSKLSLALSILTFILIYIGLDAIADNLGLPTYIDFGETITVTRGSGRYGYDEDISGESTDIGIYILVVSCMLAWRVYHWATTKKIEGNLPKRSIICWNYWISGLSLYILVTTPIWLIDIPNVLQRISALAIAASIGWFLRKRYYDRVEN